jgi:hypothetical protein
LIPRWASGCGASSFFPGVAAGRRPDKEGRFLMATSVSDRAVSSAQTAWEQGFSIVVSRLNDALREHGLEIEAAAPKAGGLSLNQCGRVIAAAAIPFLDVDSLWPAGEGFSSGGGQYWISNDHGLTVAIQCLKHDRKWDKKQWKKNIVDSVTRDAEERRKFFADNLRSEVQGKKPLSAEQKKVFDYICKNPGKFGKDICTALAIESESVLTRHCIPALKPYGIINVRSRGYFHKDSANL